MAGPSGGGYCVAILCDWLPFSSDFLAKFSTLPIILLTPRMPLPTPPLPTALLIALLWLILGDGRVLL